MGCDIHLHTEVKINGTWHHYGIPNVDRNYTLFAKMAGVRNNGEVEPIAEPRGLPPDVTGLTQFDSDHWNGDGHSHSYLLANEIVQLKEWIEGERDRLSDRSTWWQSRMFGYLFGNDWTDFMQYPTDRPKGLEDIRFVFWFDN